MKKIYFLLYSFVIPLIGFSQQNHIECGTSIPSAQEIELTQNFIRNFQSNTQNLRPSAETVYIPIKLHVVIPDNGDLRGSFFSSKSFNQSLAYTNAVYKKANIQFFVTGSINYIKSSKLLNITVNSSEFVMVDGFAENIVEEELCRPHEIPNVINLFFVNNSTVNGALATSYAKLPNPTSITKLSSYRIVMTALAIGGYGDLKFPVLAHEIGHHFSLHHPFDAIGGKELVKRGAGSNCETAGDLVCDTPADPHNEISNADKLLCGDLPPNYKDANGDIYKPDMTNVMTYYSNYCKNTFTAGQYERILAGLALRKTSTQFGKYDAPDAVVTPPTITAINNYEGGVMQLFIKDNSNNETGFIIERANSVDGEFIAIGGIPENATVFTDELVAFDNLTNRTFFYRIRASNSKTGYSNVFEKTTRTKYNCIPAVNIKCGETSANMVFRSVKATGSTLNETYAPCRSLANYTYLNTKEYAFQTNTDYVFEGTVQNDIQAYHNIYAWIDKNRNGTFDSNERIFATNYSPTNRPPDKNFKFTFSTKDLSGTYTLRLRFGFVTDLRDACAGVQQGETNDYVIKITGGFALTAGAISTPAICPNASVSIPLTLDGTPTSNTKFSTYLSDNQGNNFKEITSTYDGVNLKATIPTDTKAGSGYKLKVISVNPASESVSPTTLTIKALPTADFETKEATIQQYKSLEVKLNLTGDVPINVKLSDNQAFDFNELSPTIKLSPNATTEYKISSVSNTCGNGTAATTTLKVTVTPVLANEPNTNESFQIFPNPSAELITVKLNNFKKSKQTLQLIDNKGIIIFQKPIENDEETISLRDISTGTYIVRVMSGERVLSKRVVKVE
jgi:GEVED domain/Secretion system C-terminal sorting domain/Pregnancy-associated plasma protein-A